MTLRTGCRHYRAAEPCAPHKQMRVRCHECCAYDPMAQLVLIVNLAEMGDVVRTIFPPAADDCSRRLSGAALPSPIVPVMLRSGAPLDRFRARGATGGQC